MQHKNKHRRQVGDLISTRPAPAKLLSQAHAPNQAPLKRFGAAQVCPASLAPGLAAESTHQLAPRMHTEAIWRGSAPVFGVRMREGDEVGHRAMGCEFKRVPPPAHAPIGSMGASPARPRSDRLRYALSRYARADRPTRSAIASRCKTHTPMDVTEGEAGANEELSVGGKVADRLSVRSRQTDHHHQPPSYPALSCIASLHYIASFRRCNAQQCYLPRSACKIAYLISSVWLALYNTKCYTE